MSFTINLELKLSNAAAGEDNFTLQLELKLPADGVTVVFGHSGSGKTTFLRCLAGLQEARGSICLNQEVWLSQDSCMPCHKRSIGYVFQEASLLPHLSVKKNLRYGLKRSLNPSSEREQQDIINLMGIAHTLNRYPAQLSGGERQRAAIARALMIKPQLLLMDEPLAALDPARKQEILPYLEKLKHTLSVPMVYVTHSPDEVARLADYLVVMESGRCVAQGKLTEVLSRLDLPLKMGEDTGVVVSATVVEKSAQWSLIKASFDGGQLWVRDDGDPVGAQVRIRVLARDISIAKSAHSDTSIVNVLEGRVLEITADKHPAMSLSKIQVGGQIFIARTTNYSNHQLGITTGSRVWIQLKSVAVVR